MNLYYYWFFFIYGLYYRFSKDKDFYVFAFKYNPISFFAGFVILLFSVCSCNYHSQKEYKRILDSLNGVEMPLVLDTIAFFYKDGIYLVGGFDSITPENIRIRGYQSPGRRFYIEAKHIDSLFWNMYEYNSDGFLECYYREYLRSGGKPTGYVLYYDQGELLDFCEGRYIGEETGFRAKFSIYDVLNMLKDRGINILKQEPYICYIKSIYKEGEEMCYDNYFWMVVVTYYMDECSIDYQHKLRIDPDTGKIVEEWIEQWK